MADGRQGAAWARTAATIAGVHKSMTGQGPRLIDLIPKQYLGEKDPKATAEQDEAEAALAFAELESGLRALSQARQG